MLQDDNIQIASHLQRPHFVRQYCTVYRGPLSSTQRYSTILLKKGKGHYRCLGVLPSTVALLYRTVWRFEPASYGVRIGPSHPEWHASQWRSEDS